MVTWFKALLCWGGGGNVTFGVYSNSRPIVLSVRHSGLL